jgi:hypothetical protein
MAAWSKLDEYLHEIRQQVCSRCPGQAEDEDPREPWGTGCRLERELPGLIDALHTAYADLGKADAEEVCACFALLHGSTSICPTDELSAALVRAVARVDDRQEQWAHVRGRVARLPHPARVPIGALIQAYEAATGTCTGCD